MAIASPEDSNKFIVSIIILLWESSRHPSPLLVVSRVLFDPSLLALSALFAVVLAVISRMQAHPQPSFVSDDNLLDTAMNSFPFRSLFNPVSRTFRTFLLPSCSDD